MSKHQSNSHTVSAAKLLPNSDKVGQIAIQTGLVKRMSSKFNPLAFVMVCMQATIGKSGTLEQLASELAKTTTHAMSRSGLFQRFTETTVCFFVSLLYETLGTKIKLDEKISHCPHFKRILIEDSTQFKMNAKNSPQFPAHGNGVSETAGCKVDFTYDLLSKKVLQVSLHTATEQDKEIGKQTLMLMKSGDLSLRDMGYFIIKECTEIEGKGAFWLSRLPANVHCFVQSKNKQLKLEEVLSHSKKQSLDLVAYIGEKERKKVRLVAVRVDEKTLAKRRRERAERDAKAKRTSNSEMKERDRWHIMVTNIECEKMTIQELSSLYRLRWQIELSFKAWKQSGGLSTALSRKSNPYYLQSMVLAGMIRFILSFRLFAVLQEVDRLSMDKLFKRFCEWLSSLISFKNLSKLIDFEVDDRHIQKDLRKRSSLEDLMNELFNNSLA